ncbi:MAG: hypothetical protein KatS3mg063_2663 [Tepidiforma sp.]|uniref:hypothetical protein n=1 Tax=Tepidiforma sp. TaxID=2682230 RepID=UPI0021DE8C4E|nr:hypothetical protein [Tepidiforma sp.]GIW16810.1 MAG: hypothetical protein KatS3mg063_2663 [Tepidiforma sp.]
MRQNISISEQSRRQIEELAAVYGNMSAAIEEAVARLHRCHYPPPDPPHVVGWEPVVLAAPAVCAETQREIPAFSTAYREIWSDGRIGAILSREALVEDGVIVE